MRCYERLGIFRDTVGDLEEVLGETVQALNRLAADPSLTPNQLDAKARQEADNVLRRAEEQRRLEAESAGLLGLDAVLDDETAAIEGTGRFVTAGELRDLVERFLADALDGARLTPSNADETDRVLELNLPGEAQRDRLRELLTRLPKSRPHGRRASQEPERPVPACSHVRSTDGCRARVSSLSSRRYTHSRDWPWSTGVAPQAP